MIRFMRYMGCERSVRLRGCSRCDCRAIIIVVVYELFDYYQSFTDVCVVFWLPFLKCQVHLYGRSDCYVLFMQEVG